MASVFESDLGLRDRDVNALRNLVIPFQGVRAALSLAVMLAFEEGVGDEAIVVNVDI